MSFGKVYYSDYPDNPPSWYWIHRLHDACIVHVESFEFPFDYNKFVGPKCKYNRNLLILKIDAKSAMFDTKVKEIRFFNCKILSESMELTGRKKIWWLADKLTEVNGRYELDILLEDVDSYPEQFHFKLRFDRAETDRT